MAAVFTPIALRLLEQREEQIEQVMKTVIHGTTGYKWEGGGKKEFAALQEEYRNTKNEITLIKTFYSHGHERD